MQVERTAGIIEKDLVDDTYDVVGFNSSNGTPKDEIDFLKNYLKDILSSIRNAENRLHTNYKNDPTAIDKDISTYHMDIMNISQRLENLLLDKDRTKNNMSLFKYVTKKEEVILVTTNITKEDMKQTKLRYSNCGLTVSATVSDKLEVGDAILEVNGENTLNIDRESWHKMRKRLSHPYQLVVMRASTKTSDTLKRGKDNEIEHSIDLMQIKLEEKLQEGKCLTKELYNVKLEKEKLSEESTRMKHRIAYLEERLENLCMPCISHSSSSSGVSSDGSLDGVNLIRDYDVNNPTKQSKTKTCKEDQPTGLVKPPNKMPPPKPKRHFINHECKS